MRWINNLKRNAKECKDGTYEFASEYTEKMQYEYYEDMFLMNEEELTFKQSESIEKALKILRKAIMDKYPDVEIRTYLS